MNHKSLFRAGLFGLSFAALLSNTALASDETTIKVIGGGDADVLVLRDLDTTLPVGETREFTTESGKTAIVGRTEDGLIVDIDGEQTDIALLAPDALTAGAHSNLQVWVEGEPGDGEAVRIEKRVAIVHAGDAEAAKAHAEAHGNGHRVMIFKGEGEGDADIEALLAGAGLDDAGRKRVMIKIEGGEGEAHEKQVIVTRRVHHEAD